MDHLQMRSLRLTLYFIIGLLLGAVSVFSFAADGTNAGAPKVQYIPLLGWTPGPPVPSDVYASDGVAACRLRLVNANDVTASWDNTNHYMCYVGGFAQFALSTVCPSGYQTWTASPFAIQNPGCKSNAVVCPPGSTNVSGTCTCNSGLVFYDGQCKAPVCTGTGSVMADTLFWPQKPTIPPYICSGGCKAVLKSLNSLGTTKVINGTSRSGWSFEYDGTGGGSADRCTPPGDPNTVYGFPPYTPATPESCGNGASLYTSNGKTGCVNASTGQDISTAPSTSETKTNSSTSTTNADGSKTVTNITTNQTTGGTTTITNVYGAGCTDPATCLPTSVTSSTTGGGANGEGNKSSGSGNGNGDHPTSCDQDPERVGCKHLSDITGEVPTPADINSDSRNMDFAPASGFGSGSYSCPATEYITVQGRQIPTANWGPVCDFANLINPIVIAFAFLGAAVIAFAGRSS